MGIYNTKESFRDFIKTGHSLSEAVAPAFNKVFPFMFDIAKISNIVVLGDAGNDKETKKDVENIIKSLKGESLYTALGDILIELPNAFGVKKLKWNISFGKLNGNTIEVDFNFAAKEFDGVDFTALLKIDEDNMADDFYDMMRWWFGSREDPNLAL